MSKKKKQQKTTERLEYFTALVDTIVDQIDDDLLNHVYNYYKENDVTIEDWLGATFYYETQKEFFNECHNQFGISYYRLKKVCGKVGDMDIETYMENAYEKLTDYLREKEEIKVNAYLDGVKKLYLYDEVTCIGRASNGEAFYKKVS